MSKLPVTEVPKFIIDIYNAYPRKVGRRLAFDAIQKALIRLTEEQVYGKELIENARGLYRVVRYFSTTPRGMSEKWCWHPTTFFNQEHYLDNPQEWQYTPEQR